MDAVTLIGLLLAVIGGFVGLAGWLSGRDKKNNDSAEWRGIVNTKLDAIMSQQQCITEHERRITIVERDLKTSFARVDDNRTRISNLERKQHA